MSENPIAISGPEEVHSPRPLLTVAVLGSLVVSAISLASFVWIAEEVSHDSTGGLDSAVRSWVHQFASPTMTRFMQAASFVGSDLLVALLILSLIVFLKMKWRRAFLWMVTAMAGALVLDLTLKHSFHRPRPLPFFGSAPHSWSFPSGHALFSFCFYAMLAALVAARVKSPLFRILIWVVAGCIIVLIGVSRIYLGVHYPTDVLAGYLAAALWISSLAALDRIRAPR